MYRTTLVVVVLMAGSQLACSKSEHQMESDSAARPVARVRVYKDGRLTLDDRAATIEDVRRAFDRLHGERGSVAYYREAGQGEPPPIAMEVMRAIVEAQLPVHLSTKPDFSDAVGPDGVLDRNE
jgi:hypothetical protein